MRDKDGDDEEERKGRESNECGVSVEGEYTFSMGVSNSVGWRGIRITSWGRE
jgi:hypothetical protein